MSSLRRGSGAVATILEHLRSSSQPAPARAGREAAKRFCLPAQVGIGDLGGVPQRVGVVSRGIPCFTKLSYNTSCAKTLASHLMCFCVFIFSIFGRAKRGKSSF